MGPLQAHENSPRTIRVVEQRPPHHIGMKGVCLEPWCDPFDGSPLSGVKGVDPSLVLPALDLPTQNPLLGACLEHVRGYPYRHVIEVPSRKGLQGPCVSLLNGSTTIAASDTHKQVAAVDETQVKIEQHTPEVNSVPEQSSQASSARIRFVTERVRNKARKARARKTGALQPVSDASIVRRRAHTKRLLGQVSQNLEPFVGSDIGAIKGGWSGARNWPVHSDYQRLGATSAQRGHEEDHHRRASVPEPAFDQTWIDLEPGEVRRGSCPAAHPLQGKVLLSQGGQELHLSGLPHSLQCNREPREARLFASRHPVPGSQISSQQIEGARLRRRVRGCRSRRARTAPAGPGDTHQVSGP